MPVMPVVTLYVGDQCGLCVQARALLDGFAAAMGFTIDEVDIASDRTLEFEYRWAVPVVIFEGRQLARAPIRAARLEDALREALALGQG